MFVGVALTATLLPERAHAFWPFSDASAATYFFTPDSTIPLLRAATNVDPNPDKGIGESIQMSDNAMLAYTGPSGTIADVPTAVSSDAISVYVVRPGDSLADIATMFDVSVNTIIWANNLSSARDIHAGDALVILPVTGTEHTVVKGDTLKSLANKYNADATEIAQFNGLDSSLPLEIGSSLIIPGGEVAIPTPSTKKKASHKVNHEPYLGGSGAAQSGYYSNPVPGALFTQGIHGWNGIDLGAARGTPIHAAADGMIIVARNNGGWNGGYGNYVVITHNNGTQTLYGHMTHTIVSSGQSILSGQIIGYLGSTGLSTGPHLHFEVRGAANPFRNCTVGTVCEPQ